jgi:cell division transport system permease protein
VRTLEFAIREGWAGIWRTRGSSVFAVVAIALAALVLASMLMVTWNIQQVLARWTDAAEFSVYLRDDASSEQRGTVEALIDGSGVASGREYVSKANALERFRREFADLAPIADGFDDNPFPASVEVRIAAAAERGGRVEALVERLEREPGVADVRYDREWLARMSAGLQALRRAGFTLAALMALAAAVTVAAVVRLGLYARRDELEIMELVGAPVAFIRGPFVAEGLIQGGAGAALALGILRLVHFTANAGWGAEVSGLLDGAPFEFLPLALCSYVLLGGMALGSAGGYVAARHAG